MNRALRRLAARAKPTPKPKVLKVPPIFDEFEQFDDIDRFMQKLLNGQIETQAGHIIMTSNKGEVYQALPALQGWMDFWRAAADKFGISYNDEPMRKLANRLELGMMLSHELLVGTQLVIQMQRRMFKALPRAEISSLANTVQIKLLIEDMAA